MPDAPPRATDEALVDSLLASSRALVAVAARSLAALPAGVTLPQYRALVVLASHGPQTVGALAEALGVTPSTTTRMCDRLVAKRLVLRQPSRESRREVHVTLAARGRDVVAAVTRRRRDDLTRIVSRLRTGEPEAVVAALEAFTSAAGEPPDDAWVTAWDLP